MNLYEGRLSKPSEQLAATSPSPDWEKRYNALLDTFLTLCQRADDGYPYHYNEVSYIHTSTIREEIKKVLDKNI